MYAWNDKLTGEAGRRGREWGRECGEGFGEGFGEKVGEGFGEGVGRDWVEISVCIEQSANGGGGGGGGRRGRELGRVWGWTLLTSKRQALNLECADILVVHVLHESVNVVRVGRGYLHRKTLY